MRIAGRLAVGAVAAGLIVMAGAAAPAARAATVTGTGSPAVAAPAATGTAKQAVAKPGAVTPAVTAGPLAAVRARWAEIAVAATGKDLWSRSSVSKRPMGSVTKVMTAYVVLTTPKLNLNRVITVPAAVVNYDEEFDASTAGLRPGEKLTTLQLLYAMMLPSGCDAAFTLATAYGPGFNGFIAKMNATAHKLGLNKTHFTDPAGLPNPGQYSTYSTVHDLVNLGRDAMKLKTLATVVGTRSYHVAATSAHRAHTWKNLNPLLAMYKGALGIKTGYTGAAGQCLLFEAKRGTKTFIGVVLDSSNDISNITAASKDAAVLLNWAFSK
ncbi:D-alanyl-D-alanine carboxypeptidase [Trebonia kvetii]|uniref:D-alanyl-D-alanine carboxypeptidase n=1 Tax=Trebonia kvetii TaxID=2480626 RepID=A0A6P2C456_9ACTN|nr:D-alanyl-D-alanine carboxypeptidase [Trebonia kvetii]TVZ05236.1 D-alanyl-D-alanine carboxypeptidase [Trebonia kvetii]